MNDLRTKLAALFRRCTSPDVSDDEAAVALREFRSLGVTRREIDEALGVIAAPAAQPPAPAAQPPAQGFVNPTMPYGKYGPKHPKGAWLLTRIVQVDRQYLVWLLSDSDPPPKPWIRKQVEMALAGVPIDVAVSDAPAPAADDRDVPF